MEDTEVKEPPLLRKKVDYISELPDCILSYIQSMISMKDMMNTSVLSKRWSNLWHLRRDLCFDGFFFGSKEELLQKGYLVTENDDYEYLKYKTSDVYRDEFVKRVDQFVKNFEGTKIDSFHLYLGLNRKQSNTLDEWIRFAIARGVETITLSLWQRGRNGARYSFPFGLSYECNNSTLKVINLVDCVVCHPATNFEIFPFINLTTLDLEDTHVDVKLLTTLFSNCLLLEELCLYRCQLNSSSLKIVSSSLRHLELEWCESIKNQQFKFISLDCLKLTSFVCHQNPPPSISMNTPILNTIAHFDFLDNIHDAFALFATLPKLEILNLNISYNCYLKVISIPPQIIQTLNNLREFNLCVLPEEKEDFGIWWILDVLQASPFLQKLSVMIDNPEFYANQRDIQDRTRFSHNEIKVVELRGCVGNWYEIEFAMNALKYIHKLERIVLSPFWGYDYSSTDDCEWDPSWPLNGRKRVLEKLQDQGIELDKLVLK